MRRVGIVTDSAACLPPALIRDYDICVVPFTLIFGSKVYRDGVDVTTGQFYRMLQESPELPTTSQPSVGDFLAVYQALRKKAEGVVSIHVPATLSGTLNSAVVAARLVPELPVQVVDCGTAAMAQGFVVLAAARAAVAGAELDEVVQVAEEVASRVRLYAMLGTLKYLARSGRVPDVVAFAGSALNIHPVLSIRQGQDVLFVDDNFLLDIRRARQIARLLKERRVYKRYKFEARSDAIATHPDVISLWREVGLDSVFMGFEAPDEAGLEAVNKHNSVENNERALEILRAHDIEPVASFIVHPDYERSDFQKLHAYIQRWGLRLPAFTVLTPLPGTVLFEDVRDRILTTNYELFDLLHSVLPTHLPTADFYREFANLYRSAYSRWRVLAGVAYVVLRDLWRRNLSPAHWRALWEEGWKFTDPTHYLEDLAGALAKAEMAGR